MKKCIFSILIIYLMYVWLPPIIAVIFPVDKNDIVGNYIVDTCKSDECLFYHLHFTDKKLIMQGIDTNGTIKLTSEVNWSIKNGHSIVLNGEFDRFYFPHFGDIHRNLFFPWIIKIEVGINGKCELEQWNFATKLSP